MVLSGDKILYSCGIYSNFVKEYLQQFVLHLNEMETNSSNNIDIFSKAGRKEFEQFYIEKYLYVHNLIKHFPRQPDRGEGVIENENVQDMQKLPARLCPALKKEKQPAKTIDELFTRLYKLRGIPKLTYKDKLEKRNLKKKLMKKEKKERRKKLSGNKVKIENDIKPVKKQKPIYNSEGQMIFSKFDFSVMGAKKSDFKKNIKDPQLALKKLQEQEMKLKSLKEAGEMDKLREMVEKNAVKTALLRSEGVKVKDDTELLKKSIKKKKSKKEKSAKKWEAREHQVQKEKDDRQRKRSENIQARAHQKKVKKLKKAAKKGRIIPGF